MLNQIELQERLKYQLLEVIYTDTSISNYFAIAVNGSYNYDLATEQSDVDSKLLVVPSIENLIWNTSKNYLHIMKDNKEHVEIKDIRNYMKIVLKQNINFVETLFAKAVIVNPKYIKEWDFLQKHREEIARYDKIAAINCMLGMAIQQERNMSKYSENRKNNIDKFGYDTKSFYNVLRVYFFIIDYIEGKKYIDCLTRPNNSELTELLLDAKNFGLGLSYKEAIKYIDKLKDKVIPKVEQFKNVTINTEKDIKQKNQIDYLIEGIIKKGIKL